ncbi:MAG: DegT/DnrJ/EryC1/StrS family aminotransferase [bacterium]
MNVPLLDLKAQYKTIKAEIDAAVAGVFESQYFILGPVVKECEVALARYCGCSHGVGVSSGTDALLVALMAENIGPGDEVITTPYSFFATAGSIVRVGARPVFVDIDPATFNINPALIKAKITPKTKAIIPVHLYGLMAGMDEIMQLAGKHGLAIIEDAAQAVGSSDEKGRRACSVGHYGCLSFFPSKNLGGAGDGGMVVMNDAARAEKVAWLRNHGAEPKYYHKFIGGNFRLDALQAAVVLAKLKHLDSWTAARRANAVRYDRLFAEAGLVAAGKVTGSGKVQLPCIPKSGHVVNQYVIRVQRRDELRAFLSGKGVGNEVYYPVPLHLQECFAYLGGRVGDCPESEKAANETVALPVYPELSDEQARYVVACIAEFLK